MIDFGVKWRLAVTALVLAMAITVIAADDVPPRTEGGQALVPSAAHLDLGEVYHVAPGEGTQLIWTAEATLMRTAAICNRVVGYFVAPFDVEEGQSPLLGGVLRIPVASLSTGNERYDAEMHGPRGLHLEQYPEITFRLTGTADVKLVTEEKGRRHYTLNVTGDLTVKEKTVEVTMPAEVRLVPFTWQTMRVNYTDMLILRANCEVSVVELGLAPAGRPASDVSADMAKLDLYLMCGTMSPERNLYPNISHEQHHKQLRFLTLLRDFNDPKQGYEFGRKLAREIWDDAPALNRLAWATLTAEGIQTRDLGFAMETAQRANELTEFKDPDLLNTLAQAYHDKAEHGAALKWARKAAENLEGAAPDVTARVKAAVKRYETLVEKQPTDKPEPEGE